MHELHKVGPGMLQSPSPPHVPPHITLAVDDSLITCNDNVAEAVAVDEAGVPRARQLPAPAIRRQRLHQQPAPRVLRGLEHGSPGEEERHVAGEVEAAAEPRPHRQQQRGAACWMSELVS